MSRSLKSMYVICFLIKFKLIISETSAAGVDNNMTISNTRGFTNTLRDKPPYSLLPLPRSLPYHSGMQQVYHCGRAINDSRGFIHTPSFPKRFPVPILCRWALQAPPGKKIVLYFTQFYMRESFQLTEYDSYTDEQTYRGRHELGTVSFEDEVTSFSVYRPWLVLKFQVSRHERFDYGSI